MTGLRATEAQWFWNILYVSPKSIALGAEVGSDSRGEKSELEQ